MTSNKKLLFVLPSLKTGGAEKFVCNLAAALNKHPNYDVHLFILGGVRDAQGEFISKNLCELGVVVKGTSYRKAITVQNLNAFTKFVNELEPDVILSSVIQADLAIFLYKLRLFKSSKNIKFIRRVANSSVGFINRISDFLFPLVIKENVLCSPALQPKSKFVRLWHKIIGASFTTIINGVPPEIMANLEKVGYDRIKEEKKISEEQNLISPFSVGRLDGASINSMQKGFDLLIEAYAKLENSDEKLCHVIYGNGPLKKDLIALIEKNGLSNRITIQDAQVIDDILRHHSVLVLPSRFEGLSNVVVESLLSGCFVYLSNIPENQIFSYFSDRVRFFENTISGISNVILDISSRKFQNKRQKLLVSDVQEFFSMRKCVSQYILNFEK